MQTAKHWSLATRWPPSPCCRGTHARVAVSRPLIAPQLRTGSSRHGGMGDFVHAAVTCYILINSPAGKKYKSNHVCNNFSFFIHRETMERLYIYGGTRWIEDDCSATFSEFIFLFPACLMISHWLKKNAELNSVF